jgi:hypothetical protein
MRSFPGILETTGMFDNASVKLLITPNFAGTKYGSILLWRFYVFMKWEQKQRLVAS